MDTTHLKSHWRTMDDEAAGKLLEWPGAHLTWADQTILDASQMNTVVRRSSYRSVKYGTKMVEAWSTYLDNLNL